MELLVEDVVTATGMEYGVPEDPKVETIEAQMAKRETDRIYGLTKKQLWATIVGILVAVAGVIVAIIALPVDSSCDVPAASVSAPTKSGSVLDILVHVSCAPTQGHQYVVITELPNIDAPKNPHPVYFPNEKMGRPAPGDYSYRHDLTQAAVGSTRIIYVIDVDQSQFTQLGQNTVFGNGILKLPDGSRVISNRATSVRSF